MSEQCIMKEIFFFLHLIFSILFHQNLNFEVRNLFSWKNLLKIFFLNKNPQLSSSPINSIGPLGTFEQIKSFPHAAASTITKPGSSHSDAKINNLLLYIYLKIFFLYPPRITLSSKFNFLFY